LILLTPTKPSKISAAVTAVFMVAVALALIPASESEASGACSTTGATNQYGGGDGNSGTPFEIDTPEQLALLSTRSEDWGKHFVQMANVDLDDCEWSPIGTAATKFTGSYNGSGLTIEGFKINTIYVDAYNDNNIGLFGFVSGGTIQNLVLDGVINSNGGNVGGLVGKAENASTVIQNVKVLVDITFRGGNYAAGIVGSFTAGTIRYSAFLGSFSASEEHGAIGSFTGYVVSGNTQHSYGRAAMSGLSGVKAGMNGYSSVRVSSSYTVTPGANFGITGFSSSGVVTNSFWDTTDGPAIARPDGAAVTGATGKTTTQLKEIATYTAAGWNIVSGWEVFSTSGTPKVWGICSSVNDGYPFLLWEYTTNPCTSAPGAPTISAITAGNGQLSVAFAAPGSDGGASITNYDYSIDDGATWVTPSTPSTTSPVVITGLTNATVYPVKIRARNSVGEGTESNSISGTPVAPSSSSSSSPSPVATPVAQVTPRTVRQPTIQQATADRPVRLLGKPLVKDVLFIADSAALSSAAKQSLKKAARLAKASDVRLALTGFAAVSGKGSAHEKAVAQRRALAVAKYLRKQGVEGWIYYHGLPAAKGKDFPGQPRRVEIRILK
jgi:outer membrane protein OmpA-like peptidoglycan-associated protein